MNNDYHTLAPIEFNHELLDECSRGLAQFQRAMRRRVSEVFGIPEDQVDEVNEHLMAIARGEWPLESHGPVAQ